MRHFRYKQVIVVRTDLRMSKGKTAVQVAHGSISAFLRAKTAHRDWANDWLKEGQKKVTLKVQTQEELLQIAEKAQKEELPFAIINDAGLTELPPGTTTVVGIGPAPEELIDKVTGQLSLL
ncbi:MAG: peptidyl-tRNA hydrolase Pth2 [Candidatus Heimdallarchaeaceae archaeon]